MTALRPEREDVYGEQPYGSHGHAPYAPDGAHQDPYGTRQDPYGTGRDPYGGTPRDPYEGTPPVPYGYTGPAPGDQETMALRVPPPPPEPGRAGAHGASAASGAGAGPDAAPGGRAARRKAAKRRGGHRGAAAEPAERPAPDAGRPLSRVEARRRARRSRPGAAVVASRALGEVFITTGVLMLLFVTYQLWWTNVRAQAAAGQETSSLQQDWANGRRAPGVFAPGQGFAILHIPKLDVVAPIAEGVSNKGVLDKGMVGHYGEAPLKTAMPDARTGNFGLAAHRNTHGEPFRYINRLAPGDAVVVETQDTYYVYKVTSSLPVTPPSNTRVLDPVPPGSGFTRPGRYITLTTCTPEFTSKYRLIVWGKMVEVRPRDKGKPDALIE
ncbi:class E sortase [Streptomyces sp. J2-1]|uniref:class E sortase n=1 Tax=Streptomyces corallincola TaxID=2851888 RepID=UPI001C3950EB|nr:class E sortase [Streptomyces corallincola]MBV2357801.1 class E sortase [Streptomyces corallincola]